MSTDDSNVRSDRGGWISGPCLNLDDGESMSTPSDQRFYEPRNAQELENEFPNFEVFKSVNGLWYARLRDSRTTVTGGAEDLVDMRDKLIV